MREELYNLYLRHWNGRKNKIVDIIDLTHKINCLILWFKKHNNYLIILSCLLYLMTKILSLLRKNFAYNKEIDFLYSWEIDLYCEKDNIIEKKNKMTLVIF